MVVCPPPRRIEVDDLLKNIAGSQVPDNPDYYLEAFKNTPILFGVFFVEILENILKIDYYSSIQVDIIIQNKDEF